MLPHSKTNFDIIYRPHIFVGKSSHLLMVFFALKERVLFLIYHKVIFFLNLFFQLYFLKIITINEERLIQRKIVATHIFYIL